MPVFTTYGIIDKDKKEQPKNTNEAVRKRNYKEHLSADTQRFIRQNFVTVDKETVRGWLDEAKDNDKIWVGIPDGYFSQDDLKDLGLR